MIRLSLTDFVDIVSKSGVQKATKVAQIKSRGEYEPAFDFYKPLRDHIVETHRLSHPKASIGEVMGGITDTKKLHNYPGLIEGYIRWWGRKKFQWFDPVSRPYAAQGIEVYVNPELGLQFKGENRLVKLYFKSDPLSKQKVGIIMHLMEATLRPHCKGEEIMSILDIRNSRLLSFDGVPFARAVIDAELAYVASLWPLV